MNMNIAPQCSEADVCVWVVGKKQVFKCEESVSQTADTKNFKESIWLLSLFIYVFWLFYKNTDYQTEYLKKHK